MRPRSSVRFLDFRVGLEVACVPLSALLTGIVMGRLHLAFLSLERVLWPSPFAVGVPTCVVSAALAGVLGGLLSRGTSQ